MVHQRQQTDKKHLKRALPFNDQPGSNKRTRKTSGLKLSPETPQKMSGIDSRESNTVRKPHLGKMTMHED